ncbi:glucose-6-phosphate isomerase, partial [Acinetobacter baumannii]
SQLLNGQIVNHTVQQAAVHAALRLAYTLGTPSASPAMAQICADLETMLAMGEFIRSDATVHDVVHIGIGGSSLGPEL